MIQERGGEKESVGSSKHADSRMLRSNSLYGKRTSPSNERNPDKKSLVLGHHNNSGQQLQQYNLNNTSEGSVVCNQNKNLLNEARLNRHHSTDTHQHAPDNQHLPRPSLKSSSSGSRFYANKIFASMSNLSLTNQNNHSETATCDSETHPSGTAENDTKGKSNSHPQGKGPPLAVLQSGACPFVQTKKSSHLLKNALCTLESVQPTHHGNEIQDDEDPSFQGQVEIQGSLDSEHSIPVSCQITARHDNGVTESKLTLYACSLKLCELYLQHVTVEAIPGKEFLLRISTKSVKSPASPDETIFLKCKSNLEHLVWIKALQSWGAEIRCSEDCKSRSSYPAKSKKNLQSIMYFVFFVLFLAISLPCCRSIMLSNSN